MNIPQEIKIFLLKVIEDAGHGPLTDEVREQMVQDMYMRLDNKLTAVALEHLPEGAVAEFSEMLEQKADSKKINAFLESNVSNVKEIFANAMLEFRKAYLGEKS